MQSCRLHLERLMPQAKKIDLKRNVTRTTIPIQRPRGTPVL